MKTRLIFILMCMMALLPSCTSKSPQDALRAECAAANESMPQDLGNSIIVRSVSFTDGNVVYHLTCDENFCPLYDEAFVKEVTEEMRQEFITSDDPEIIELVRLCRKANANAVYEYRTLQGNTYTLTVPL
ncbi:MAG: hypothetical protein K2N16_01635 [Muribaculaceae bacterium]|nr:hypothetical protein [Muribaculaceae bacterium]